MSEKEALQMAADEARKLARAAREFGGVLDDYAKYLTQQNWRGRADELHLSALNKLSAINEGMASCTQWVAASGRIAAEQAPEQASEQPVTAEVRETPDTGAMAKARTFAIKKREKRKGVGNSY